MLLLAAVRDRTTSLERPESAQQLAHGQLGAMVTLTFHASQERAHLGEDLGMLRQEGGIDELCGREAGRHKALEARRQI